MLCIKRMLIVSGVLTVVLSLMVPIRGNAQSLNRILNSYGAHPKYQQQQQYSAPQQVVPPPVPASPPTQVPQQQIAPQPQPQAQPQAPTYPADFQRQYVTYCVAAPTKGPAAIQIPQDLKTDFCACLASGIQQQMTWQEYEIFGLAGYHGKPESVPRHIQQKFEAISNRCFVQTGAKMFFGK